MISEQTTIETSVKRALKTRIGDAAEVITVADDHGTITLAGPVFSMEERTKVVELARATQGVVEVKDHLYFHGYRTEW